MAGKSLEQLGQSLDLIVDRIDPELERAVRGAALVADQVAVLATPVDTGRARANWIASVAAPAEGERVAASEDNKLDAAQSANESTSQAGPVIAGYRVGAGGIFLANNVPYIAALDAGSSKQAPKGMVNQAVQAAIKYIRSKGFKVTRG